MMLFTTKNGDIILRAGQQPDSTHDFCVHKLILSLASPVFRTMFNSPQPPHQAPIGQPDTIPVINIPDSPEALDVVLRVIYPGVAPPKIDDLPTLTAVFPVVERYKIASIWPILGQSLTVFLPGNPSTVYTVAWRFGLLEVAKEAARALTQQIYGNLDCIEEQRLSSTDLSRFTGFAQSREDVGRSKIRDLGEWSLQGRPRLNGASIKDRVDVEGLYSNLVKEVEERSTHGSCTECEDRLASLLKVANVPHGYNEISNAVKLNRALGAGDGVFLCPLSLAGPSSDEPGADSQEFDTLNCAMVAGFFEKGFESG